MGTDESHCESRCLSDLNLKCVYKYLISILPLNTFTMSVFKYNGAETQVIITTSVNTNWIVLVFVYLFFRLTSNLLLVRFYVLKCSEVIFGPSYTWEWNYDQTFWRLSHPQLAAVGNSTFSRGWLHEKNLIAFTCRTSFKPLYILRCLAFWSQQDHIM